MEAIKNYISCLNRKKSEDLELAQNKRKRSTFQIFLGILPFLWPNGNAKKKWSTRMMIIAALRFILSIFIQ